MRVPEKAGPQAMYIAVMMHFNFRKEGITCCIHFVKIGGLQSSHYVHKLEIYTTFAVGTWAYILDINTSHQAKDGLHLCQANIWHLTKDNLLTGQALITLLCKQ